MRAIAVGAILIALAVTGCIGQSKRDDTDLASALEPGVNHAQAQENLTDVGLISGLIINDEHAPIVNATVLLPAYRVEVLTTSNGSFEFRNVPVGKHVVQAYASGHKSMARSVEVHAEETSRLEIVLVPLPVQVAHYIPKQHKVQINLGVLAAGPDSLRCVGCSWITEFPADPDYVLVEVEGKHAVSNPAAKDGFAIRMSKVYDYGGKNANGSVIFDCYYGVSTVSGNPVGDITKECAKLPIRYIIDRDKMNATMPKGMPATGFLFQVDCNRFWVCLQETYTVYITAFYWWMPDKVPDSFKGSEPPPGDGCLNGVCFREGPSSGQGRQSVAAPLPQIPTGRAQVLHFVHVPAVAAESPPTWPWVVVVGLVLLSVLVPILWRRRRAHEASDLVARARQAFADEQDDKARQLAKSALRLDARNTDAWFLYGSILLQKGHHDRVIEELEAAMKDLGPQMSGLAFILSLAYQRNGQPEAAQKWLPVVARDPEYFQALGKETDFRLLNEPARAPGRRTKNAMLDPSYV